MQYPSELSYSAFLQYSPRGESRASKQSQIIRAALKNDGNVPITKDGTTQLVRGIDFVVTALAREIESFPFLKEYLGPEVALVPIPRSAPLAGKDALWPSRRICDVMVKARLGAEVLPLLVRKVAVQKSATAAKGMRPGPEQHYESTFVDSDAPALIERPITMVDDFVTRGSSFIGMFRRIREAFPNRKISCFALMRTESDGEIEDLKSPVQGKICYYPSGKLWRSAGTAQQPDLL